MEWKSKRTKRVPTVCIYIYSVDPIIWSCTNSKTFDRLKKCHRLTVNLVDLISSSQSGKHAITLTSCASCKPSLSCGSCSRLATHRWVRTCWRAMRWWGSTCNILATRSLARGETESQLPPDNGNLPSPMRTRMSPGVSLGPFANGVWLNKHNYTKTVK